MILATVLKTTQTLPFLVVRRITALCVSDWKELCRQYLMAMGRGLGDIRTTLRSGKRARVVYLIRKRTKGHRTILHAQSYT